MALNRGLKPLEKEAPTPMINGFKLLQATPLHKSATSYKKPVVEPSPMITWGKIEDTSFLGLEKGNGKQFRVPDTPSRDELGFHMASKVQGKKREQKRDEKARQDEKLSRMTNAADQKQNLSKAGKQLLETIMREKSMKHGGAAGSTPVLNRR